jgi:hypothetical protein
MFLDVGAARGGHPSPERGAHPRGSGQPGRLLPGDGSTSRATRWRGCSPARRGRGKRIPALDHGAHRARHRLRGSSRARAARRSRSPHQSRAPRRVSPQNVLVGGDGISRITDFGVARAASRLVSDASGSAEGLRSPTWRRRQAQGDELLDRRADVFSAGIVGVEGPGRQAPVSRPTKRSGHALGRIYERAGAAALARCALTVGKEVSDAGDARLDLDRDRDFSATRAALSSADEPRGQRPRVASAPPRRASSRPTCRK